MYGSLPALLAFVSSLLAVFTADSALPLDCECPGLEHVCSKSHFSAKFRNVSDMNCGPLSETNWVGLPYLAKCALSLLITLVEELFNCNWSISQKLL